MCMSSRGVHIFCATLVCIFYATIHTISYKQFCKCLICVCVHFVNLEQSACEIVFSTRRKNCCV